MLTKVEDIIPKWKIVPTKDVINLAFKDPAKRERVRFFSRNFEDILDLFDMQDRLLECAR